MAAVKASEKLKITKQLLVILKDHYKGNVPKVDRPVLETILYSICLENCTGEEADTVYVKLFDSFHDLNEARVSSMFEMTDVFEGFEAPEWKAMRIRKTLHHVFETNYSYDLENLKRKTLELAQKHLKRIKALSPFSRMYALHVSLGSHLIPTDEKMKNAAIFLGLADVNSNEIDAADEIKPAVRKSDITAFCYYIRCLGTDPKLKLAFEPEDGHPEEGHDVLTAPARLEAILKNPPKPKRKKKATKKTETKKTETKKTETKKPAAKQKATKKTATKKTEAKKPVAKKKTVAKKQKPTSKKTATKKKTVTKKVVKKKAAVKQKSATKKKTAVKKTTVKKTVKKKTPTKKTAKKKSKKK